MASYGGSIRPKFYQNRIINDKVIWILIFRFSGQKWVCDLEKWVKVAESGSVCLGPLGSITVYVSCLSDKLRLQRKKKKNNN